MPTIGIATIPKTNNNIKKSPTLPNWPKVPVGRYNWPITGTGYLLPGGAMDSTATLKPIPDQNTVRALEPYGTKAPTKRLDRTTGYAQVQNVSHEFTMQKVQAAIRAAETGDTRLLFTYYRDFIIGNGTVVAELSKRKLATLSDKWSIVSNDKKNKNDNKAAESIRQILNRCDSFETSLIHLQNAVIYPIAVCEKMFEPIDATNFGSNELKLRVKLKSIDSVDYNMISYKLAYLPNVYSSNNLLTPNLKPNLNPLVSFSSVGSPEDVAYDPDSWEPDLRFWEVLQIGSVTQIPSTMIRPDPFRNIVYRNNLLQGIARDNFGGLGRSLLFLSIMEQLGLDVFLQCLQRYGVPLIVAKIDTSQVDTVNQVMEAFGNINITRALAINKDAEVQLEEINMSGAADAHTKFLEWIADRIALLINGQTLSSHTKSTGLGNGQSQLAGGVRDDIINYDRLSLNHVLKHQLFRQLLDLNGIDGECPNIVFGSNKEESKESLSTTIMNLSNAGWRPTEDAIEDIGERFGFPIEPVSDEENVAGDNNNAKEKDKELVEA